MAQASGRGRAAAVLAVLSVFGFAACDRGGNGGSTAIVRTVAPASGSPGAAPATPSVSPINDRSKLCSRALGRVRDVTSVSDVYWKLAEKSGFGDPAVSEAGDKFRSAEEKTVPLLRGLAGSEAPRDVADAVKQFADAADAFSDAAGAHSSAAEINPLASSYGDALDALKAACQR